MADNLTPKQRAFVQEYLVDLNGTQAAIRAGYSKDSARAIACENLTKPDIQEALAEAMRERGDNTRVTAERVLSELAKIGFSDIRNIVKWGISPNDTTADNADPNGLNIYPVQLIPVEQVDNATAAAISEISLTQTGVKVKLHDKLGALREMGRHLGIADKVEHSGPGGGAIPIVAGSMTPEQAAEAYAATIRGKG